MCFYLWLGGVLGPYKYIAQALNGITIGAYNYGFKLLCQRLTKKENHRTVSDYENKLITRRFGFQATLTLNLTLTLTHSLMWTPGNLIA